MFNLLAGGLCMAPITLVAADFVFEQRSCIVELDPHYYCINLM